MSKMPSQRSAVLLLVMLLVVAAVLVVVSLALRTNSVQAGMGEGQVMKVLLVLHDDEDVLATDVFLIQPESKQGALFDIAGNTGAIYRSLGSEGRVDRIDEVYRENGIDVYRGEVSSLVGVEVPFSLEINLDDFGLLTDLLGGMRVFIPSAVDATGPDGERWLLPAGAVTLDGDKVQTYLSYILPEESAGDRDKRRQEVMVAFLVALGEKRGMVLGKKNFPYFSSKMKSNVQGDDFFTLVSYMANVDTSTLTPTSIAGNTRVVSGKELLFPYLDGQFIKDVVKLSLSTLLNQSGMAQSRVYVLDIYNGTATQGLARNTSALLQGAGYNVLNTGNASDSQAFRTYLLKYGDIASGGTVENDVDHTLIINHIGNDEAARALGNFIRCYNIDSEDVLADSAGYASGADVDFTLVLGKDFDGQYVRGGYNREEE